jgi:thiamine-phosphate pyrophosphorylase
VPDIRRILDANANRAREAARVMEEAARFILSDAALAKAIKLWRHDLAAALIPLGAIELHRDTPGDVGTSVTAPAERSRSSVAAVVIAAGKRLSEAMRVLEEYGKVADSTGKFASSIKQLRYRGYALEQQLVAALSPSAPRQWRLCVLITESLCAHHDWLDVARASVEAGADCIQLREKSLDSGPLLDRAHRLVQEVGRRATVIINDRPDIALLAGAHGVHLGQTDLSIAAVRRLAGHQLLVGSSTHNLTEARAAMGDGADYCGVGAMFVTTTKQRKPSGIRYLQQFIKQYPGKPHLAIGGVSPVNIAQLVEAGARGVAVSSVVCGDAHPGRVVRKLLKHLPPPSMESSS